MFTSDLTSNDREEENKIGLYKISSHTESVHFETTAAVLVQVYHTADLLNSSPTHISIIYP